MYYIAAQSKLQREAFLAEAMGSPPQSVFVHHGYVQHARNELRGEQCTCYNKYLATETHDLPDAIAFEYGDSTALDPQTGDQDEHRRMNRRSRKLLESESGELGLSMFVLDGGFIFKNDQAMT